MTVWNLKKKIVIGDLIGFLNSVYWNSFSRKMVKNLIEDYMSMTKIIIWCINGKDRNYYDFDIHIW